MDATELERATREFMDERQPSNENQTFSGWNDVIKKPKKKSKRRECDFYPTPAEYARACLSLHPGYRVPLIAPRRILDPGAGTGVWGDVAREVWPNARIEGMDIRNVPQPASYDSWYTLAGYEDWASNRLTAPGRYDLIMGNPPFSLAEQFIRESMELLAHGGRLIFLLRLAMLESEKRITSGLWEQYPPSRVVVFSKRPSFTGTGTDATAYAAFEWIKSTRMAWETTQLRIFKPDFTLL